MLQGVSCLGGGSKYRRGSEDCERPVVRHLFHLFTLKGALRAPIKCDDCLRLARNGLGRAFRRGPLLKVDRKSSVHGQNGAIDPQQTFISVDRKGGRKYGYHFKVISL